MKITALKTYKSSVPITSESIDSNTGQRISSTSKTWLFLKLETDVGIESWGEGSGEWLVPSVDATLHAWRPLLIDQDPLQAEALCEDIMNRLPWKSGSVFGTAVAAINMALYDIAGKAWGVPTDRNFNSQPVYQEETLHEGGACVQRRPRPPLHTRTDQTSRSPSVR